MRLGSSLLLLAWVSSFFTSVSAGDTAQRFRTSRKGRVHPNAAKSYSNAGSETSEIKTPRKIRHRRDLLDLADMFDLLTGLDPTDYIPYGNWCGYGGQGKPIDRIDECCKVHDHCYGASEKECSNAQVHIIQYAWKINNETIICEDESICEFSVCKCDQEVVECIAQHNHTYSEHYRFIRKFR